MKSPAAQQSYRVPRSELDLRFDKGPPPPPTRMGSGQVVAVQSDTITCRIGDEDVAGIAVQGNLPPVGAQLDIWSLGDLLYTPGVDDVEANAHVGGQPAFEEEITHDDFGWFFLPEDMPAWGVDIEEDEPGLNVLSDGSDPEAVLWSEEIIEVQPGDTLSYHLVASYIADDPAVIQMVVCWGDEDTEPLPGTDTAVVDYGAAILSISTDDVLDVELTVPPTITTDGGAELVPLSGRVGLRFTVTGSSSSVLDIGAIILDGPAHWYVTGGPGDFFTNNNSENWLDAPDVPFTVQYGEGPNPVNVPDGFDWGWVEEAQYVLYATRESDLGDPGDVSWLPNPPSTAPYLYLETSTRLSGYYGIDDLPIRPEDNVYPFALFSNFESADALSNQQPADRVWMGPPGATGAKVWITYLALRLTYTPSGGAARARAATLATGGGAHLVLTSSQVERVSTSNLEVGATWFSPDAEDGGLPTATVVGPAPLDGTWTRTSDVPAVTITPPPETGGLVLVTAQVNVSSGGASGGPTALRLRLASDAFDWLPVEVEPGRDGVVLLLGNGRLEPGQTYEVWAETQGTGALTAGSVVPVFLPAGVRPDATSQPWGRYWDGVTWQPPTLQGAHIEEVTP